MKLAAATFLLGVSFVAADLGSGQTADFIDGAGNTVTMTNTDDITVSIAAAGHSISCTRSGADGDAFPTYAPTLTGPQDGGTATVTFPRGTVADGVSLAYLCSVIKDAAGGDPAETLASNGGPVLVVVDGAGCDASADSATINSVNHGSYAATSKNYVPEIQVTRTYACIQAENKVVSASVDLKYKKKSQADGDPHDLPFVGVQVLNGIIPLSSTDGLTFSGTAFVPFDIGTDEPHPSYFRDNQFAACNELCKGGLVATADGESASKSTIFSTNYNSVATSWKFTDCSTTTPYHEDIGGTKYFTRTGIYTMATVCASVPVEQTDTANCIACGSLYQTLECPYNTNTYTFSTKANMQACLASQDDATFATNYGSNTCQKSKDVADGGAGNPQSYNLPLGTNVASRFSVSLYYEGNDNGAAITQCTLGVAGQDDLSSALSEIELTFTCAHDAGTLDHVREKYLLVGGTSRYAIADDVDITSFQMSIPKSKSAQTYQIFGLYHKACGSEAETALSDQHTAVTFAVTQSDSGVFNPAGAAYSTELATNICRKRYSFTADNNNVDLANLVLSGADYFVCKDNSESNADCIAANRKDLANTAVTDLQVYLPDTCNDLSANKLGGLVSFVAPNTVAARVICGGACAQSTLYDLTLDWTDTFEASLVRNDNKLQVTLGSDWSDNRRDSDDKGLNVRVASAYIGASDDCLLDGRLATPVHTVANECKAGSKSKNGDTVVAGNGVIFTGADDGDVMGLLDLFQVCGDHPEEDNNPFVYLNQQFSVTYADEDNGKSALYCNSKKLTVGVADMSGQITAVMTVNAEVGDDFALAATVDDVQMTQCTAADGLAAEVASDYFKIVAKVSLEEIDDVVITFKEEAAENSAFYDATVVPYANRVITWETDCSRTCVLNTDTGLVESDVPAFWGTESTLKVTMTMTPTVGVAKDQDVQMKVAVLANPCDSESGVGLATVDLVLLKGSGDGGATCAASNTAGPVTPGDNICAVFSVGADLKDSKIQMKQQALYKRVGTEWVLDAVRTMFDVNTAMNTDIVNSSSAYGEILTDTNDAGQEFKLVVDYEQDNNIARRRLRAEYVFGASDNEVEATIKVLPAVQVQDELEAGDENIVNLNDFEANSPSAIEAKNDNQAEKDQAQVVNHGAGTTMYIVISLAVVGAFGLVAWWMCGNRGTGSSFTVHHKSHSTTTVTNPDGPAATLKYMKVRRSERFSTPKF